MIGNMLLIDARDNRNLCCCWIDVSKAYDSLSHSWVMNMLEIHRFPMKLQKAIEEIMKNWNTILVIPVETEDVMSVPFPITNGVFQGDILRGNLFTLSFLRYTGYTLSKPTSIKITHTSFL